jgi:hypothetical protein
MPVPAPDAGNQIVGAFAQQVQAAECLTWAVILDIGAALKNVRVPLRTDIVERKQWVL